MKLFLSEEKTNLGRQREFDYAKVIAIVFMVLIHVWEELSYFDCFGTAPTGFWHNLLQFGAGPLAAPLFMFAMGVGICYSSHRSPKDFAKRGVQLFFTGYLLNFFRNGIYFAIYYWLHGNWDITGHYFCPVCNDGNSQLESRGYEYSDEGEYDKYVCAHCGAWFWHFRTGKYSGKWLKD